MAVGDIIRATVSTTAVSGSGRRSLQGIDIGGGRIFNNRTGGFRRIREGSNVIVVAPAGSPAARSMAAEAQRRWGVSLPGTGVTAGPAGRSASSSAASGTGNS